MAWSWLHTDIYVSLDGQLQQDYLLFIVWLLTIFLTWSDCDIPSEVVAFGSLT